MYKIGQLHTSLLLYTKINYRNQTKCIVEKYQPLARAHGTLPAPRTLTDGTPILRSYSPDLDVSSKPKRYSPVCRHICWWISCVEELFSQLHCHYPCYPLRVLFSFRGRSHYLQLLTSRRRRSLPSHSEHIKYGYIIQDKPTNHIH